MGKYECVAYWNCYKVYRVEAEDEGAALKKAEKLANEEFGMGCYHTPNGVEIGDIDTVELL